MTDKQNKIITTAAAVFSKYGYKKTTIDEIVATAGISKGLFYHYYTDKKQLYLALYEYYVDIMSSRIRDQVDLSERDLFERLKQISHIRIEIINEYPNLWGFLYSAYYEQHPDVAPLIRDKNEHLLMNSFNGSAGNIDWSKLKPGISPSQAIQAVTWIAEGFVSQLNSEKLEFDKKQYEEFDAYLELLKSGIYQST